MPSDKPADGQPETVAQLLDGEGVDRREAMAKLDAFEALLRRWNRRYNLVSKRDAGRLRERHVRDSLALLPWWRGRLADVGSGAGLPGLPLAIVRPKASVVLIERSLRKSRFLRQAVIDLQLGNVEVVAVDAGRYRPAALFDTVVARAMAPADKAWPLMRPLLARQGSALLPSMGPLDAALFDGGAVQRTVRCGVGWLTVVRQRH